MGNNQIKIFIGLIVIIITAAFLFLWLGKRTNPSPNQNNPENSTITETPATPKMTPPIIMKGSGGGGAK